MGLRAACSFLLVSISSLAARPESIQREEERAKQDLKDHIKGVSAMKIRSTHGFPSSIKG